MRATLLPQTLETVIFEYITHWVMGSAILIVKKETVMKFKKLSLVLITAFSVNTSLGMGRFPQIVARFMGSTFGCIHSHWYDKAEVVQNCAEKRFQTAEENLSSGHPYYQHTQTQTEEIITDYKNILGEQETVLMSSTDHSPFLVNLIAFPVRFYNQRKQYKSFTKKTGLLLGCENCNDYSCLANPEFGKESEV